MPPIKFAGELSALATAIAFSIGPALFTLAGQQVGSQIVNRTRLVFAAIFISIMHTILLGQPIPISAQPDQWFWFSLSGIIGLTLGDAALFQALLLIGPRLTVLIFATSPIMSALMAWAFLDETLKPLQIVGMGITLAGVLWVIAERNQSGKHDDLEKKNYLLGIFFAFLGALGQAGGLITAKFGFYGEFPSLSGLVIRMLAAMIALWVWTILSGKAKSTIQTLKQNPLAVKHLLIASFVGPFIGVWFSLTAIQYAEIGIASTLMALNPIFLIPVGYFVFQEKITLRAIIGTVIALSGVAVLFLV